MIKQFYKSGLISLFTLINFQIFAQISGCTDPLAKNFDANATINDGSCLYKNKSIKPISTFLLDSCLPETSGLIQWNNLIWTFNDDTDTHIYGLDSLGKIAQKVKLPNVINRDWEEISQDSTYIYVGDIGNNGTGKRKDLKILRVSKPTFLSGFPQIDTIWFTYSNQIISTNSPRKTDFDCEAFIVDNDSIYLFTKQWISTKTTVYSLPKTPGRYIANPIDSFDVNGLITGATYLKSNRLIILSGYSKQLKPFIYLLYDFKPGRFFTGNKRKVKVSLPFHQIEGVSTLDGLTLYCSNEHFSYKSIIKSPQELHVFNLSKLLESYVCSSISSENTNTHELFKAKIQDSDGLLKITTPSCWANYTFQILNNKNKIKVSGKLNENETIININQLKHGHYIIKIKEVPCAITKFILHKNSKR